ncbi:MAG: glycosyltransferase family 1 protein [Clostridia bacterium]|nr:glycosyltransferase family 1 protein [Clostridia bacterium]
MARVIKVLHIGLSQNRGGIEMIVYSWWKQAQEADFRIGDYIMRFDFINVYDGPIAFEKEFMDTGSEVFYIPKRRRNPVKNYLGYKRIIEIGNYDYVHCHVMSLSEPEPVIIGNDVARKNVEKGKVGKPQVILHSHTIINDNTYTKSRALIHTIGKWRLHNMVYHRIACGHDAGKTMFGGNDFTVIENGIEQEKFRFNIIYRKEIRAQYGIKENDILIGLVGRYSPPKNLPYAIASFADIVACSEQSSELHCQYKLMLIGDMDCREIRDSIRTYGIERDVIFVGKVSDVYRYYSAMDVFYQPSLYEGISVAMIEAQASGLPCVVSEYVARESDVSGRVSFIKIDDVHNVYGYMPKDNGALDFGYEMKRMKCSFRLDYDVSISARKIFQFYINNL